jgi:endonuclease/exonuclease/phosphatase family metal-dependent hydrolase
MSQVKSRSSVGSRRLDGSCRSLRLLSWNVRGLNEDKKCAEVKDFIVFENPDLVCLQEIKPHTLNT